MKDLFDNMEDLSSGFSKGQKIISAYITENYDKAAFMTASKLGEVTGVSESTVVRFASELGYDGYPQLQKALQDMVRAKFTTVQRMEMTKNRIGEKDILTSVLNSDMEMLRSTLEGLDKKSFSEAVDTILNAEKIYLLGVRSSAALCGFMGFYFNLIFDNVRLIQTNSVSEMFEQMLRISECDVIIGISFPRYSARVVKALQFAKDRNAKVIAITDSVASPLASKADHVLTARSDMVSFIDSLVAPLSVINALIVAVGTGKKNEIYSTFEKLENIWDEYGVYDNR